MVRIDERIFRADVSEMHRYNRRLRVRRTLSYGG